MWRHSSMEGTRCQEKYINTHGMMAVGHMHMDMMKWIFPSTLQQQFKEKHDIFSPR